MSVRKNRGLLSKGEWRVICSILLLMLAIGYPIFLLAFVALPTSLVDGPRPSLNATIVEGIMETEREILGIPDEVDILLIRTSEKHRCRTEWENPREFTVTISADSVVKNNIQHEMYHISRVNGDHFRYGLIAYFYVEEPLAIIYASFGIRLDFWN